MGRPTKLTPEVQKAIIDGIRGGNYAAVSAKAAGIAEGTYYAWLKRGRAESKGRYHEFAQAVEKADASAEAFAVLSVRRAMGESWQAAMTYLERRWPDRWGRRSPREEPEENSKAAVLRLVAMLEGEDE